jgi:hypothetical protein
MAEHVLKFGQLAQILKRFTSQEQENLVAAIRSICCCRVQKVGTCILLDDDGHGRVPVKSWSLAGYNKAIAKMTEDEHRIVIDYVMRLYE